EILNINGTPVPREPMEDYVDREDPHHPMRVKRWKETLPNGRSYAIIQRAPNGFYNNTPVYVVPPDHYLMIGDNRDNSTDSRVLSAVGYIPFDHLIGRVETVFLSLDNAPGSARPFRWERIGTAVH